MRSLRLASGCDRQWNARTGAVRLPGCAVLSAAAPLALGAPPASAEEFFIADGDVDGLIDAASGGALGQCDPQETQELLASDGRAGAGFGIAISISGERAIIGAPFHDGLAGDESGAAYAFRRDGSGAWFEAASLVPGDANARDQFGSAVAISGGTAIVGAPLDSDVRIEMGSAYIFREDCSGSWPQAAKLAPSDSLAVLWFGWSVAIDGDTAVVGAPRDGDNGPVAGAAYVFRDDGAGNWAEVAKLVASDGDASDFFGRAVALRGDTVIVGADQDEALGDRAGSAYVFREDRAGNWVEVARLNASDGGPIDFFGSAIAIDGATAIISAPADNEYAGCAYVFREDSAGDWLQIQKLTGADAEPFDQLGFSVAIAGDLAIIGSPGDDDVAEDAGAALVFRRDGAGSWNQNAKIMASDGAGFDNFGTAVALSGEHALSGAWRTDDLGASAGSTYALELNCGAECPPDFDGDGTVNTRDFLAFLNLWAAGDPQADWNGDTVVNTQDFLAFLNDWAAAFNNGGQCP